MIGLYIISKALTLKALTVNLLLTPVFAGGPTCTHNCL